MEEEVDYYFNEDGFMVFTAAYHLKRGYCCKNGCKHCPWNYKRNIYLFEAKTKKDQSKDE
jgi:hypothetical protein